MTCNACSGRERHCEQTFTCARCHRRLNVCRDRVGKTRECATCWERRNLGPGWAEGWREEHNAKNKDHRAIAKIVKAAQEYQEEKT